MRACWVHAGCMLGLSASAPLCWAADCEKLQAPVLGSLRLTNR